MASLSFEWDPVKVASNLAKHGVAFDEAVTAFLDERARIIPDPDHSTDEEREILLGMSGRWRLVVVCYCHRGETDIVRIFSARAATRRERSHYRAG